jgi:3-oxoacyl-[acyl-carrier-protein] synthase II
MPEPKRVCITGIGAITPFGRDAQALWDALVAARSCIRAIEGFPTEGLACRVGGEVRDYAPREDLDPGAAAAMDRRSLLAADAAIQALVQAEIPINAETVSQIGVAIGSELPQPLSRTTAADIARTVGAAGPVLHAACGAASGLMAIGEAAEWIRREDCSIAVAGGADTPVSPDVIPALDALRMLTHNNAIPERAVRPYDAARNGFALSDGAGVVVLEDEDVAIRRGATILAYLDGYGATFNRAAVAEPRANEYDAGRAMQKALLAWDVTLQSEIDVIFGTAGGGAIDAIEGKAVRRVWGPNTDRLYVTAIKGALGHTLGASGPLTLIAAIYALQSGLIPPTLNLERQDPECGDLDVVTGSPRRLQGTRALVNAFGLGHNASLIVSRP